jgi:hypothetical protein
MVIVLAFTFLLSGGTDEFYFSGRYSLINATRHLVWGISEYSLIVIFYLASARHVFIDHPFIFIPSTIAQVARDAETHGSKSRGTGKSSGSADTDTNDKKTKSSTNLSERISTMSERRESVAHAEEKHNPKIFVAKEASEASKSERKSGDENKNKNKGSKGIEIEISEISKLSRTEDDNFSSSDGDKVTNSDGADNSN